jgi:hypothetical protein
MHLGAVVQDGEQGLILELFTVIMVALMAACQILAVARSRMSTPVTNPGQMCSFDQDRYLIWGRVKGTGQAWRHMHPDQAKRCTKWEETRWIATIDRSAAAGF